MPRIDHRSRRGSIAIGLAMACLLTAFWLPATANAAVTWSSIPPMPGGPRNHLSAASAPDGLYVLGGDAGEGCGGFCDVTARAERYSAATNSWTTLAPMHMERDWLASATGLDGKVYAIGGYNPGCDCVTDTAEVYSPATNSWAFIAPLPVPRLMAAATTGPDGRIYLLGGGSMLNEGTVRAFAYTPSTNTWASLADMHDGKAAFGAATGGNGKIYAFATTAEAYSPVHDRWTKIATPSLRGYLAGASGQDGRIYAVGGCCTGADAYTEVDVYSTRTKTWSLAPSMLTGRSTLGAAVGGDGNLYAAGGDSGLDIDTFDSAEMLAIGQHKDLKLTVYRGPKDAKTLVYTNAGDLTSGGYAAAPSTGTPTSLDGTGTIPSTTSGSATVSFHISFDAVASRWTGTAVIDDPGGGFTATIPVHSGAHGIVRSGTFVSGRLRGIKALSVPQNSFLILFGTYVG
jgi:N-acetylneuraminic acid mutarotase